MITRFDKGGVAAHFKKKFGDCLRDFDYEGAIDYLLKYREEKNNADFHLACGMLYLQMSLDSDDNELICLAYREIMMHIARFPDCTEAYRDLLAALLLRRDGIAFVECCRWLKDRNVDFREVMGDLAECGALFISSEDDPPDFDMLFEGEYGEIERDDAAEQEQEEKSKPDDKQKKSGSKIIAFGETPTGENAARVNSVMANGGDKVDESELDELFSFDARLFETARSESADGDGTREYSDFINAYLYGDDYDDEDADAVLSVAEGEESTLKHVHVEHDKDEIHRAEDAYDRGDFEKALDVLSKIRKSDERYYFALTMRALINIERASYDEAEKLLLEAESIKPHGALGGTLLCQLYEAQHRTELIPDVLKDIDVKDYVNTPHLYKAFDMAIRYCDMPTAAELINSYIDEFNIMEMRLVYAQIMYNLGNREYALEELYKLSRIFYDDINAKLIFMTARSGIDKFSITTEAPQSVLAAIVENLLGIVLGGMLTDELMRNEMFLYSVEFLLTLEYRNDKRLLVKMFDAIRILANHDGFEERARDALVSPYAEPIVKAVLLGELLGKNPDKPFLAERSYCPIASDSVKTLDGGLSPGYYIAYAFVLMLCYGKLDEFIELAKRTTFTDERMTEESKAYFLVKTACGNALNDDRVPLALGFNSKTAALRDYKATANKLKG